jgi:hypothetical protein
VPIHCLVVLWRAQELLWAVTERFVVEEEREKKAEEEQRKRVVGELDLEERRVPLLLVKVLLEEGVVVAVQMVLKMQQLAAVVL